jgi:hypothetical protein
MQHLEPERGAPDRQAAPLQLAAEDVVQRRDVEVRRRRSAQPLGKALDAMNGAAPLQLGRRFGE